MSTVTGLCQHARESVDKLIWVEMANEMKEANRTREKIGVIDDDKIGMNKRHLCDYVYKWKNHSSIDRQTDGPAYRRNDTVGFRVPCKRLR